VILLKTAKDLNELLANTIKFIQCTGKSGESKKFELTRQWALTADLRPVEIWSRDQVQLRM
jgi:hypothetical protein